MNANYPLMPAPLRTHTRAAAPAQQRGMLPVTLAAILLYLLLIPQQFNMTVADVYLSPYRVFLIGATLYLFSGVLLQKLRLVWPDLFIALAMAWIWLSSFITSGSVGTSVIMGGSHTVDIGLSYFLARAAIQTPNELRRFLILVAPGVGLISAILVIESVSHTLILQRLAGSLTGAPFPQRLDVRMGLMRGFASFPHPILAGIFLGSFLPLYLLSGLRGWPKVVGILASIGGALSMSSAAMLALMVGGLLYGYDWLGERIANLNWRIFLFFSAVLYVVVELTSNSGFYNLLIRYASLNTTSAYNRVLIWEFGTENIARSPWFGIGYSDWIRPAWMHSGSFDHFWLITALRFGIPETFFLLGATLMGLFMVTMKSRDLVPHDARLLRGVAISLAVFALGLNSVSLWMSTLAWFFVLLGITVSLGSMQTAARVTGYPARQTMPAPIAIK